MNVLLASIRLRTLPLLFVSAAVALTSACQPASDTSENDPKPADASSPAQETGTPPGGDGDAASSEPVDFVTQVKPLLESECLRCHNSKSLFGGFNLETREKAMAGGTRGVMIVPGNLEGSRVYQVALMPADKDHAMPATGAKLTSEQKETLRRWIADGAPWPDDTPLEYLDPDALSSGEG